jgi:hypothetical protein
VPLFYALSYSLHHARPGAPIGTLHSSTVPCAPGAAPASGYQHHHTGPCSCSWRSALAMPAPWHRGRPRSGWDASLPPRLVGIFRKKVAGFPLLSFEAHSPFLCPAFAVVAGVLKRLFTELLLAKAKSLLLPSNNLPCYFPSISPSRPASGAAS